MITPDEIKKIIEIIQKNQSVFIFSQLGSEYLTEYQKTILKNEGIDVDKINDLSEIEKSYYFGMYSFVLGGRKSFKAKNKDFNKWLEKELNKPLSTAKKQTLEYLKNRTFTDISGLGNRITNKVTNTVLTSSLKEQQKLQTKIKKTTIKAVKKNWSQQKLASELREITEDWARDFSRISDFVLQEAYGFGRAMQILDEYGEDVLVYKQTFPGVCSPCEKHYGSPGQKPVIYKLKDLLANGNNIGRKEQLPVAGNAHPWARSILHVVPPNSEWSDEKKKFVIVRNKKIKRKSKVKVTIKD